MGITTAIAIVVVEVDPVDAGDVDTAGGDVEDTVCDDIEDVAVVVVAEFVELVEALIRSVLS